MKRYCISLILSSDSGHHPFAKIPHIFSVAIYSVKSALSVLLLLVRKSLNRINFGVLCIPSRSRFLHLLHRGSVLLIRTYSFLEEPTFYRLSFHPYHLISHIMYGFVNVIIDVGLDS